MGNKKLKSQVFASDKEVCEFVNKFPTCACDLAAITESEHGYTVFYYEYNSL